MANPPSPPIFDVMGFISMPCGGSAAVSASLTQSHAASVTVSFQLLAGCFTAQRSPLRKAGFVASVRYTSPVAAGTVAEKRIVEKHSIMCHA